MMRLGPMYPHHWGWLGSGSNPSQMKVFKMEEDKTHLGPWTCSLCLGQSEQKIRWVQVGHIKIFLMHPIATNLLQSGFT